MTLSEAGEYYSCDPFIPGAFPGNTTGVHPRRPLHHIPSTLTADLRDTRGRLITPTGEDVIELGFAAPVDPADRNRFQILRMLADIAGPMRLARLALEGEPIEPIGEQHLAIPQTPLRQFGTLPFVVVAHTYPAVARVAVRSFGFEYAEIPSCAPAPRAQAIKALGQIPVTVYMPVERFVQFGTQEPRGEAN